MRSTILIVDDAPMTIHLVSTILEEYHIKFALNGKEAIELLRTTPNIDLVLLDIEMPEMNGYELIQLIKSEKTLADVPVIFLTVKNDEAEENKGFELGAVDYIRKPICSATLLARVKTHINLRFAKVFMEQQNEILENKVKIRTREILNTRDATIDSMMSLLEIRDIESGSHIKRTQLYIKELCSYLSVTGPYITQLTKTLIYNLYKTSPLHDIGKIGIPDKILLKPGKLTFDEFEVMKLHASFGAKAFGNVDETLGDNSFLKVAKDIAGSHHERWDGTGYPCGLCGNEIPLAGRIMSLADVYDALVSVRTYKDAFTHEQAKEIIVSSKGSHFDPVIVDAFITLEKSFINIYQQYNTDMAE